MMPPSLAALLGARIDGIDPSPLVAGAYLIACILLLCALWSRATRTGNRFAMAGIALAVGATIYSHDVVNLPEILSALTIGGGIALVLARRCAAPMLPWLVVAGHGLLGLAAMAIAIVLFRNPFAFAITREDGLLLSASVAFSALVLGGALTIAARRTQVGLAWLGSGSGWAAAALGFALGNSAMVVAGAMAGVAGARIGWRARRIAPPV